MSPELPETKVGLVFGTTDRVNGRENLYFRYRIDAAVRVWKAGKIETLIVSGDNRSPLLQRAGENEAGAGRAGNPGRADRV